MFNPRIKSEVSTITCNKEMKGNAKCKDSRFEPPFGGLRGNTSSVARWKARSVDFISVIIELFSLAVMAEAILSQKLSKSAFPQGWVTLS